MQSAKHAMATVKEKAGNITAKVEEKWDKAKAKGDEKVTMMTDRFTHSSCCASSIATSISYLHVCLAVVHLACIPAS